MGAFLAGVPIESTGSSVYIFANGNHYCGETRGMKPNGQGVVKYTSSSVYEGTVCPNYFSDMNIRRRKISVTID